ncbi:hypothetical protein BKA93DRAFT_771485 [Sparassis latifolia]
MGRTKFVLLLLLRPSQDHQDRKLGLSVGLGTNAGSSESTVSRTPKRREIRILWSLSVSTGCMITIVVAIIRVWAPAG